MPPLTIHLDGLWRCLCPAIDGAWARHLRSPHRRIAAATAGMACRHQPRRALQTAKPRLKYAGGTPKQRLRGGDRYRRNGLDGVPLSEIQLEEILDGLDYAAFNGQIDEVQHLVAHLMEQRGASPSLQIYAALIMVNIDAERGSAATAEALFNELREKGFTPNSTVYHNLLKVGGSERPEIAKAEARPAERTSCVTGPVDPPQLSAAQPGARGDAGTLDPRLARRVT